MGRTLRTLPALALMLALPGVAGAIGLWVFGASDASTAAVAAVVVIAVAVFGAIAPALSLAALIEAIERLSPAAGTDSAPPVSWRGRFLPIANRIWLAALRVRRGWRERLLAISASLDAAEAVI